VPRGISGALAALLTAAGAACTGGLPPAPVQPIRFNHRIHVTEAAIGCIACHTYALDGPVAGIPSMDRCRGCHKFVKQDPTRPEITAEIQALLSKLDAGTAIPWVRVYRVPDHVRFTHQPHVLAGVRCQECHGEVEKMDVMRQVTPLTMGWCLACHHRKQREKAGLERLTDCWTCHK
jgi:Cytochrome c7 and related cytochrome c